MKLTTTKAGWRTLAGISAMLLASTALTAPSAQAGEAVLNASDFTYEGAIAVHGGVLNNGTEGLTYRQSSNTWFTIAHSGQRPFELVEISLPAPHLTGTLMKATIVKDWGPLNVNGVLDLKSKHGTEQPLQAMKGLFWDSKENKLWFTFGSYYATGADNNVIGYATLDTGKPVIHGPWKVSVTSDIAKGMILEAPPELQAITNQRFLMFGIRGSTAQKQSWGTGLVSVAEPTPSTPVGTALASEKLIHWPMLVNKLPNPAGMLPNPIAIYSNFQELPGDTFTLIKGNDDVNNTIIGKAQRGTVNTITLSADTDYSSKSAYYPQFKTLVGWYVTNLATGEQLEITGWDNTTKIATIAGKWKKSIPVSGTKYQLYLATYDTNIFAPPSHNYSEGSFVDHAVWIDIQTPTGQQKHGLFYFGGAPIGYSWYGNPPAHSDPTPTGAARNNNLQSLIYPGQPIHSDMNSRGDHAEAHVYRWYVVDPDAVVNVAKKAMAGTATAQDLQIPWTNAGDVRTLGGAVQFGNPNKFFFGQSYWDAKDGLLYTLAPHGGKSSTGIVEVWKVQ